MPYTWSDNGNLLSDGATTYTYDHANRLATAVQGTTNYGFSYNGLGDRLRQTVAGTPTNYSLDMVGGLTQVLSDGTNAYLYGNGRIGEEPPGGWQYYLGDALGSVRQLVDPEVSVTLSRAYEPFGDPLETVGTGSSIFAFTGEQVDGTGLVYLRAGYYAPPQGRLLTRDVWEGDPNQPMSYNAWLYALGNPVLHVDPSGQVPIPEGCPGIADPHDRAECRLWEFLRTRSTPVLAPPGVSWVAGRDAGAINQIGHAPIFDYAGRLRARRNAAQFLVAGYWGNFLLCGQAALSAVLQLTESGMTASAIADLLHPGSAGRWEGTYPWHLRNTVNWYYGDDWHADWGVFGMDNPYWVEEDFLLGLDQDGILPRVREWVERGYLVIPLVEIVFGSSCGSGSEAQRAACRQVSGSVGGDVDHWVVITGVARGQHYSEADSIWNWVRILNPFDNQTEYYWWGHFVDAWSDANPNYVAVRLHRR